MGWDRVAHRRLTFLWLALVALVTGCAPTLHHPVLPTERLGAGRPPIIPPGQLVPVWYLDPQNVSTHAADTNNGTSSSTPLASMAEIYARWTTHTPYLTVPVTINLLSNMNASDLADLNVHNQGPLSPFVLEFNCVLGTPQIAWTGTLGTVTARSNGVIGTGGKFATMVGGRLDGGVILADAMYFTGVNTQSDEGGTNFGDVYLQQSLSIVSGFSAASGPIWGPGSIGIGGGAVLQYPSGAGAAAATFLNRPVAGDFMKMLTYNPDYAACSSNEAALGVGASPTFWCSIELYHPSVLDTCPASGSAFCGKAFAPGGGLVTNYFQ